MNFMLTDAFRFRPNNMYVITEQNDMFYKSHLLQKTSQTIKSDINLSFLSSTTSPKFSTRVT